jgi:type I restriction enzyme M protein
MASRKLRVFTDEDINKISDTYHSWRSTFPPSEGRESTTFEDQAEAQGKGGGNSVYENIEGFSKAATLDEVRAQDYKLTPGIYVGTEAVEDDGEPFEEKMARLKEQLLAQFEKGNELQERIKKNFDKIG